MLLHKDCSTRYVYWLKDTCCMATNSTLFHEFCISSFYVFQEHTISSIVLINTLFLLVFCFSIIFIITFSFSRSRFRIVSWMVGYFADAYKKIQISIVRITKIPILYSLFMECWHVLLLKSINCQCEWQKNGIWLRKT